MKNSVNGKAVTSHIFEYTSQIVVDSTDAIRGAMDDWMKLSPSRSSFVSRRIMPKRSTHTVGSLMPLLLY
jgi:hypothetical protein